MYTPRIVQLTKKTRDFLVAFVVIWVVTFVDLHFLAFYPLTIRDPAPLGTSAIAATIVGLLAGLYRLNKED
jgi:hypothetical protein